MEILFVLVGVASLIAAFFPIVIGMTPQLWTVSESTIRTLAWLEVIIAIAGLTMGFIGQRWALQPAQSEGGLISLLIAMLGWAMMLIGLLILVPGIGLLSGASWGMKAHTVVAWIYAVVLVALFIIPF